MPSRLTPFVTAFGEWLRARSVEELVTQEEIHEALAQVRADDAFWEQQRPRFDRSWARVEERLRAETRPLKELVSEETSQRLVDTAGSLEPDPEAVRTFLRSPAIEAMLGEILYTGITEFIKRADLIGRVVDKLPVLGGIRRRVAAVFKDEVEGRLEGQIKSFLGSFSGLAVDRMIQYVLSEEHRSGFREARRRVADHLLERPLQSMVPPEETTSRWREQAWKALREPQVDETAQLSRAYADYGQEPLGTWLWETPQRGRELLARGLERFLSGDEASGWTVAATQD